MSKPRDIHVGVYDTGKGEIRVWCTAFTIKGFLARKDGKVDETSRRAKEQQIQKLIAQMSFPEEE